MKFDPHAPSPALEAAAEALYAQRCYKTHGKAWERDAKPWRNLSGATKRGYFEEAAEILAVQAAAGVAKMAAARAAKAEKAVPERKAA